MSDSQETELPDFLNDVELEAFCEEIVRSLMKYGQFDEVTARKMLEDSGLCALENNRSVTERALFFHEVPYYWAMNLIHKDSEWWQNPELWPPPEDA